MDALYQYQQDGVEWMLSRESGVCNEEPCLESVNGVRGGILADEVGLGKTLMTITTIVNNPKPNTLILAPKSLLVQWKAEFERFAPNVSVEITESRTFSYNKDNNCVHVVIASHSRLNSRGIIDPSDTKFCRVKWDRVVIDEAHCIKNKKSKLHKACCELRTKIRWALTATPVMNKMLDFIYTMKWIGIGQDLCQNFKQEVAKEFIMRRTKEDVSKHNESLKLPECSINVHHLKFQNADEYALYTNVYSQMQDQMHKMASNGNKNTIKALELLLRIRQVCCHPATYIEGISKKGARKRKYNKIDAAHKNATWDKSTKLNAIMESIQQTPEDDKCLVFCHFIKEMDAYCDALAENGIGHTRLDGSMDIETRASNVTYFSGDQNCKVFVIQMNTGGVGYNLQAANWVYITSPTWNPSLQHQIVGRAHRTGQKKNVHVNVYAIGDKTGQDVYIEDYILSLQARKLKMIAEILDDPRIAETSSIMMASKVGASLTFADVAKMFSHKPGASASHSGDQ